MSDEKAKKPIWKRWWFITIAVIFIIGIATSEDKEASSVSTSNSSSTNSDEKKSSDLSVGEQFSLGDFAYRIENVESLKRIGNEFINSESSPGASFVVVTFIIRNDGNETKTVLTSDFKIIDEKGREFKTSSDATTTLSMSGDSDFILSELQPGIQKQSVTAFEVPDEVLSQGFTLVVPEKGVFNSGEAKIRIGPM